MSHNKISVNTKKPNTNGNITLNIGDIITINSPASGQLLQKKSSDWGTGSLVSSLDGLLNHYYPNNTYGTGSYEYDIDDNVIFRKASNEFSVLETGVTLPNSSGSYVPLTTTSWTDGFTFSSSTFPTGAVILLRAQITPNMTTATYATYQWRIGTRTALSNTTAIGPIAKNDNGYGATVYGLYQSTGSNTAIGVRLLSKDGQIRLTSSAQSRVLQVTAKRLA